MVQTNRRGSHGLELIKSPKTSRRLIVGVR
jgi:hypothetical protein